MNKGLLKRTTHNYAPVKILNKILIYYETTMDKNKQKFVEFWHILLYL